MKPGKPTDEVADQRLNQFVYAYTLFAKNLIEAGVDREIVKMASDMAWGSTGSETANRIKSRMGAVDAPASIRQAGAYAMSIFGNEINTFSDEDTVYSRLVKCPWHDAAEALGIPYEWRFCESGYSSFSEEVFKTLNPDIIYI